MSQTDIIPWVINLQTKDHYRIARYLTDDIGLFNSKREKAAFVFGCVFPDINLFSYFTGEARKGHTYKARESYISKCFFGKENQSIAACFRLGVAIHYLQDSFTFPHNESYAGGFVGHLKYESALHRRLEALLKQIDTDKLTSLSKLSGKDTLMSLRGHYTKNKASVNNDCAFILATSIGAVKKYSAA